MAQLIRLSAAVLCLVSLKSAFAQNPQGFVPVTPCRVVDTRNTTGTFGGPILAGSATRTFPIAGTCGIPATAAAYSLNFTVVPSGPLGFLTAWPTGVSMPLSSVLNSLNGEVLANSALIPAGTNGSINVFVSQDTHLVLDIDGYFEPQSISSTGSTALGVGASNAGSQNTAIGFNALQTNGLGTGDTAVGTGALSANVSGNNNLANGTGAMSFNVSGSANTAVGAKALQGNQIGNDNVAVGFSALWSNLTGNNNVALGQNALFNSTSGGFNIAVGTGAGNLLTAGSNNIYIGNAGNSSESGVIRIGTDASQNPSAGQSQTFIAGIVESIVTGSMVLVNSNGQLGIAPSSRRFKKDIQDMGESSNRLLNLRPVTFHYKQSANDGSDPLQYGLIAEEVAQVYPELVTYANDGNVEAVQYQQLPALLLNELQKQHKTIQEQSEELAREQKEIELLKAQIGVLNASSLKNIGNREAR